MKKLFSGILTLAIIMFTITSLYAQNSKGKFNRNQIGIEKLNLTEDQESKFNEIRFAHQEKVIDLNAQLRKNQLEIKKMFTNSKINEKDVLDLTEKSSDIRAELHKSKVKMWFGVNKILNDDQKQIWKEHFKNINGNRKARFEKNNLERDRKNNFRGKGSKQTDRRNFNN